MSRFLRAGDCSSQALLPRRLRHMAWKIRPFYTVHPKTCLSSPLGGVNTPRNSGEQAQRGSVPVTQARSSQSTPEHNITMQRYQEDASVPICWRHIPYDTQSRGTDSMPEGQPVPHNANKFRQKPWVQQEISRAVYING